MTGKKILIVDSDVASQNFIARNLTEQKYDVLQAVSGKEGLIFAWRDRPDLLIVDPVLSDLRGEDLAIKLRQDARTSNIPVIALSSDPGVARVRSCLDAGFNEYIVKSGQALPALNEAVGRLLGITAASVKQGGLLIVFLSAKGGVGTSSLCANIAMTIAYEQPESRVSVLDMVLPIGSIAPTVGYKGTLNLVTISDKMPGELTAEFLSEELTEVPVWKFHLLAGSPDPESSLHLKVERIWDIISALKAHFDYVLVDLGRSLSKFSLPLIQNADLVALIIGTDMSTVELTQTMWQYLQNKGLDASSIYAILNRAIGLEGLSKPEVEKILELPIKTAVPYLGGNFALANNQHQPFSIKFPNDTASIVFRDMAKQITEMARRLRAG
ncbi:MAG: response regulator [Chloroflexi bacterium]|nr:response regulator [Chloroflexota bacterium]